MVQFNLLPDIKMKYIRARRLKRLVLLASVVVCGGVLAVVVTLFMIVRVWEKQTLKALDKDIQASITSLKAIPDIDKILTIQNQLKSLPGLHDDKPAATRIFNYVAQLTPTKVTMSKFLIDFSQNTMEISGEADTIETANIFIDTLKFTTYKPTSGGDDKSAFSDVVLASFTKSDNVLFKITLGFDPAIFDNADTALVLTVPKIISTRSETEQPGSVFKASGDVVPTPTPKTGAQ